jgi:hypothetical protein
VDVSDEEMIIKKFYFPIPFSKKIKINQIESISIQNPELLNGKLRIWGSGDLKTWFPLDFGRSKRNKIFIIKTKGNQFKIGLTVNNPEEFIQRINKYNLIQQNAA